MPVVVVASDKGGTAKTTTVANLASALHSDVLGAARVCAIDCDPQSDLTASFGLDEFDGPRLDAWLSDPQDPDLAPAVTGSGVAVIPGGPDQADIAASLMSDPTGLMRLRQVCDRLTDDHDWVILDPPPGTAPMSTLAMMAADAVIITAAATDLDIRGATGLLHRIEDGEFDHDDHMMTGLGILLVRVKARRVLRRQAYEALQSAGIAVVPVEIPEQERVGGHMRTGRPTIENEPDGRIASAYRDVATWLLNEHRKANA